MATVKTAVSLRKPLFDRTDALARKLKIPRSHLVAMALEDFLRRQETAELVERINAAYADGEDEEEREFRQRMLLHARTLLEGEW